MESKEKYTVPAVIKAARVLNFIAENDNVGFADICKGLKMPNSTAYGILYTLKQCGYLREAPNGTYRLGIKMFSLGEKALAGIDLRSEASPLMYALVQEVGQASYLGIMTEDLEAVYIAKVECMQNLFVRSGVGMRLSFQSSATGKALLAWRDEKTVREILKKNKPVRNTGMAILDPDAHIKHLETVRQHGFSMTNREANDDSLCVAAPIFDTNAAPIGAISISTPYTRMTPELFALVSMRVHGTCMALSKRLGSTQYPSFTPLSYPKKR